MATYGFDGNSKGRVEVYSKTSADYQMNKRNDAIFLNDPEDYYGTYNVRRAHNVTVAGYINNSGSVICTIPLGLSNKYSDVEISAGHAWAYTSNGVLTLSATEGESIGDHVSYQFNQWGEMPLLYLTFTDPTGDKYGMTSDYYKKPVTVQFSNLELKCTRNYG